MLPEQHGASEANPQVLGPSVALQYAADEVPGPDDLETVASEPEDAVPDEVEQAQPDAAAAAADAAERSTGRWRLAAALVQLRKEIDAWAPRRSKALDGTIGDSAHLQRANKSDHNPWVKDAEGVGVVRAIDCTSDPAGGCDGHVLAERIRQRAVDGRETRVSYVIFDGRIANPAIAGGTWRTYKGANKHRSHVHISVKTAAASYDGQQSWGIGARRVLRLGDRGQDVAVLQRWLGIGSDGVFGPKTRAAVMRYQQTRGLEVDGVVGERTWASLERDVGVS